MTGWTSIDNQHKENYWWYLVTNEFAQVFLKPLGERINQFGRNCLDVGCGEGLLTEYVDVPYSGADVSATALMKAADRDSNSNFFLGSFRDIPHNPVLLGKHITYGSIVFGNILHIYCDPKSDLIPLLESYLVFEPERFFVYELEVFDHSPISKRFKLIDEYHASVSLKGIEDVKRHRKILTYEV